MSSSEVAVQTNNVTVSHRSPSDWIGAAVFVGIAAWTLITGWIPVLSDSILAGILLLPNWFTSVFNAVGFPRRKPMIGTNRSWSARLVLHAVAFSLPIYFALMCKALHTRVTDFAFVLAVMVGVVPMSIWSGVRGNLGTVGALNNGPASW